MEDFEETEEIDGYEIYGEVVYTDHLRVPHYKEEQ
jgi:hypothetical protein